MKKNKLIGNILLVTILIIIQSCIRSTDSRIETVESDDEEMNAAVEKAKMTFNEFVDALKNVDQNKSDFSIKVPFEYADGHEHIWVAEIELKEDRIYGYINNDPVYVTHIKLGDEIEIKPDQISDWFYIEDGKLIGGFTIRVLRDRMTDEEKQQLDDSFGVTF